MSSKTISILPTLKSEIKRLGLKSPDGSGRPLELLEYQEDFLKNLLSFDIEPSGVISRFTEGALVTGKGWGKTPLAATIAILLLSGATFVEKDGEKVSVKNRDQNIYLLSNTVSQASGMMNNIKSIIGHDNPNFDVRKDFVRNPFTLKTIEIIPLSGNIEGLVGCWILDQSESMTSTSAKRAYSQIRRNGLKNDRSILVQVPNSPEITTLHMTDGIYENPGASVAEMLLHYAKSDEKTYVDNKIWDGSLDSLKPEGDLKLEKVEEAIQEYYQPILKSNGGHFPDSRISSIAKEFENNFSESSRFFLGISSGLGEKSFLLPDQVRNVSVTEEPFDIYESDVYRFLGFDGSYGRRNDDTKGRALSRLPDSTSLVELFYKSSTGDLFMREIFREDPPPVEDETVGWKPDRQGTVSFMKETISNGFVDGFLYDESGWIAEMDEVKTSSPFSVRKKINSFVYSGRNNASLSDSLLDLREVMVKSGAGSSHTVPHVGHFYLGDGKICDDFFHADLIPRKYGFALAKKSRYGMKIDGAQAGLLAFHALMEWLKNSGSDSSSGFEIAEDTSQFFEIL